MTDNRDPGALGEFLLSRKKAGQTLTEVYDECDPDEMTAAVPNYNANPSTIEKYGDPRLLPPSQ